MIAHDLVETHSAITDEEFALVEDALRKAVASDVSLLANAGEHLILSGGKRLRPRIVLLSFKAAGGEDVTRAIPLSVAVELIHTASLIHDDINDDSDMRRGQETVNARWGHTVALLTGDFIFIKLLGLVASFDPRITQGLADCCLALVEGEVEQLLRLGDIDMSEDDYLGIVARKTASLFSACTELGAIAAGGDRKQIAALRAYGLYLGTAFQIRDDTLDLVSTRDKLGKPATSDLRQGKMSLAPLFALRQSEQARRILFSADVARAIQLLQDLGAIEYAMRTATEYASAAKQSLSILPESEAKLALLELADFAVARHQ